MPSNFRNTLYYGDNLNILRDYIKDESIDLIYLDPPFKSDQSYNVIFKERNGTKSRAQIKAFEDTWHWGMESEKEYKELVETGPKKVADLMEAMRKFLGSNDMMAYLAMMTIRLIEMKRVLKETGSIYLHCDPTASHYLKLTMDAVFGHNQFQNEIVWSYRGGGQSKKRWGRKHDIIFFYSKTKDYFFNPDPVREEYAEATRERFKHYIGNVRDTGDYGQQDLHERGKLPRDVWSLQPIAPSAKKRLDYPTQKPEELLAKVILASSEEGDIVLDPFCGCGTTVTVAEKLNRNWIGIDITHLAVQLMKYRLEDTFGEDEIDFEIIGVPVDVKSAERLAEQDRFQFQSWALGLIPRVKPVETKTGDRGIDGYKYFYDDTEGEEAKTMLIQVKSGKVNPSVIRDLKGTMEREDANMGVLITLKESTKGMETEAAEAGFYTSPVSNDYPKVQILTIKELLEGERVDMPHMGSQAKDVSLHRAKKHKEDKQQGLNLD